AVGHEPDENDRHGHEAGPVEPARPGGSQGVSVEALLAGLMSEVLGRPVDGQALFEETVTSIEMLRVVSALEVRVGALSKTLLFDHPTLVSLAAHFVAEHGERAAAWIARAGPATALTTRPTISALPTPVNDGEPAVVVKRAPGAAGEILASLEARYAKET